MSAKKTLQAGTWPSPISPSMASQRMRLDDVQWATDGKTIIWVENRAAGPVLVAQANGVRRDLTDHLAPRGGVGYGGGTFESTRGPILFAERSGRIYRRSLLAKQPYPITPLINPNSGVASPTLSPDGRWVAYVYTDGNTDLLALVAANGSDWPIQLSRGADFYMQPAWHPSSSRLAWIEWDHPNMPWDGARVQLARLEGTPPRVVDLQTVGGGADSPAQQPVFSPDGRWLCFIEETGEWPNLVLLNLETGSRRILVKGDGFDFGPEAWVQGVRSIGWSMDSQNVFFIKTRGPDSSIWNINLASGALTQIDTAPYTNIDQLSVNPLRDELVFLASASNQPNQIVHWNGKELTPVAHSTPATWDPDYLPVAREISWETAGGEKAYGLYYPPANPHYEAPGAPPAIVHVHGGPTSLATNDFIPQAAYFTSRGYAWVEVNYRGSTGYGRTYRHAMRKLWGPVDAEDTVSCARMLAEQGLADPKRLVVTGGSAGGFTVLNVLEKYPGIFKAGVCLYGVANLFTIEIDTHKFEAHYNASMVGELPEASEFFYEWSPVFHAGSIRDAIYIFQGSEDKVVPLAQSDEVVSALRAHGVPHQYKVYEGEGHGFRKPENIADYLQETERFLLQNVIFAP